jgi:hypothetical protein
MNKLRGTWYDKWFTSVNVEQLEAVGLEQNGKNILKQLNAIYSATGIYTLLVRIIILKIKYIYASTKKPVKIIDIGMRDGELLCLISKEAKAQSIPVELFGIEFRPDIIDYAQLTCLARNENVSISYDSTRMLEGMATDDYDLSISSFLLHHRSIQEGRELINATHRISCYGSLHFDLKRSFIGYASIFIYCKALGYKHVIRDSLLSVRRAYRLNELPDLLISPDIPFSLKRMKAFYFLLETHRET